LKLLQGYGFLLVALYFALLRIYQDCFGSRRIRLSHSALEAATPLVLGSQAEFFQALDADLLFISCTTISVSSLVAGHVHVANAFGGGVASAVFAASISCWSACYLHSLSYALVVHDAIKSAEDLEGRSIGVSCVGSASDDGACRRFKSHPILTSVLNLQSRLFIIRQPSSRILFGSLQVPGAWPRRYPVYK
jgi:ABC-type nitrate/sulfonate/bicarbonate transport system substrate-binding protein